MDKPEQTILINTVENKQATPSIENKSEDARQEKNEKILIILLNVVLLISIFFLVKSSFPSAQSFDYEHVMIAAVSGKHWNLSSDQGAFEKQLSVYGNKARFVDNEGNDTYLSIKEWNYKNGKFVTDDGTEFEFMKSGDIREGKKEYKKADEVIESNGDKIFDQALNLYVKYHGRFTFFGENDESEKKWHDNATEIISLLETLPDNYSRDGLQTKQDAITLIRNVIDSPFAGKWEYTEWNDYSSYIFRCTFHSSLRTKDTGYDDHKYFYGELWLIQDCYTMDGEYFYTPERGTNIPLTGNLKYKIKDGNLVVIDGGYAWTAHRYNE